MIYEWAKRWGIPQQALDELFIGCIYAPPMKQDLRSEEAVQVDVRLEASQKGSILWRNNVGVLFNERNTPVRYGLANDTPKMNKIIKSSDLIGIKPILIQPHHVGTIIGQFMARETKKEGWVFKATEREQAQLKFMNLVQRYGGDARFTTGVGTI